LGPAPKSEDPPEAPALAKERATLGARLGELRGQRTRLVAAIDDASAALARLSREELQRRYAGLLVQDAPLISPSLWREAAAEAGGFAAKVSAFLDDWRRADRGPALNLLLVAAAALVSLLLFGPASTAIRRAAAAPLERLEPTRERRLALAGVKILSRLLPGLAGGLVVIETARVTGLLGGAALDLARALWAALIGWLVAQGFLAGLFASSSPAWRLSPVGADRARWIVGLTLGGIAVFSVKIVLVAANAAAGGGAAFDLALRGGAAALVGVLIIALSRRALWFAAPAGAGPDRWIYVRRAARVLGAGLIAAAIAGYTRFADFAASRLYYGALLLAVAWAARASLKQGAAFIDRRLRKDADGTAALDEKRASLYWIGFSIDALLLFALAPAALALLGWSFESARDMTARAFAGIRIGGAVISFSDILVAVLAFAAVLAATRIVQTALQRGPLAYSRIDRGVQDSLITLIGYAGLIVAVIVGVSILGVNLSNLALIAGALSVGVGLGLQGVVNNFVSGLILLFERPIKVGDWIVTGAGQGIVRKISVRSTEIETFEKSSIIVPNSELITQPVTNMT
ncbi:MAG: mechanosensitive ion channel, partial [Parvularculaceae bacterium]|nr:mechanosensitive ion channel [Parvularculaceae bacterium]